MTSAYERERAAREHLAQLQALTAELAAAATPGDVAKLAVCEGRRTMRADSGCFYELEPGVALSLIAYEGISESTLDGLRTLPMDAPLPGPHVIQTKAPIWIESYEQYAAGWPDLAGRMRAAGRPPCLAALPLLVGDRALGVLAFGYLNEQCFDESERAFASTLAHACAQAFDRARLLEAERRMSEGLRLLAEASDMLTRSLEYETTLENVVRLAMPRLADFCFFDVREDDGSVRRIPGAHQDPETLALLAQTSWAATPPELGVCALSSGRTGLHSSIDDAWRRRVATGPEHLALLERLELCSMITVPLPHGDRLMGSLTLCFGPSRRRHTAEDVALAEEIARRAALAVEHARLYRQAEQANRAKDVFLGIVSHELRTPLTAILGWSSVLEDPTRRGSRDIEEPLRVIHQSAVSLTRLVDDILDVSRVIAGKFEIARQPVALSSVVVVAAETLAATFEDGRLTLELSGKSDGVVIGDPQRLQQVVCNLLANAAKFTPEGGHVRVCVEERDERVVLSVTDSGRGIGRDDLARVFDPFRQVDDSTTRSHGGLGLGLAIVRQLVELHGGSVRAESAGLGSGATFVVELPRATVTAFAPEPSSRSMVSATRLDGRSVLVADDQKEALELTAAILRRHGAVVTTASSAAEALASFERSAPDLLLIDIGMPVEDGYSLMRRLRRVEAERGLKRTFAAAFSAYASADDRARCLEVGYDLHIAKPVEPSELVQCLARTMMGRSRRSA